MSPLRVLALAATLAGASAGPGAPALAADAAPADATRPVSAMWTEREATFTYFGYTTHYSCDGLRDKVRWILREVGARDKPQVTVSCTNLQGVEPMPRVRIRAAMPVEATPERVAEATAQRDSLENQTRAKAGAKPVDEPTAQFQAAWQRVEFVGQPTSRGQRIEVGDCELMENMVRHVFEPLGVKVLSETRVSCVPRQLTLGSVNVQLEALRKLPEPQAATR